MILWRIATETRDYSAGDLSGGGAAKHPGRWNGVGEYVLYTSTTISLAVLETAAHINSGGLPMNKYLVQITVPDAVWNTRQIAPPKKLPPGWDAIPAGGASEKFGSAWLKSQTAVILDVPSVIVPEEYSSLINTQHPHFKGIKAKVIRRFEYDSLFRR